MDDTEEIDDFCNSVIRDCINERTKLSKRAGISIRINTTDEVVDNYFILRRTDPGYFGEFILCKNFDMFNNYTELYKLDSITELFNSTDLKNRDELIKLHNHCCEVLRYEVEEILGITLKKVTYYCRSD